MKTILIPTDFSENSWNAIEYAVNLFIKVSCNFYLLHVGNLSDSGVASNSFSMPKEIDDPTIQQKLNTLSEKIRSLAPTKIHHFIALQEYGNLIDVIRTTVIEKHVNLIVMGTKGASGIKASIMGSNTGDVITKVPCNVLVIPEKAKIETPKQVAFPTDYNIFYSYKILVVLTELLIISNARLEVVNVSKGDDTPTRWQEKNKNYLEDYLKELFYGAYNFNRIGNKNIKNAIESFVADKKVDMIVMVAKNLNLLQQLLFDTTIEKVSFHTNVPLLVLHE